MKTIYKQLFALVIRILIIALLLFFTFRSMSDAYNIYLSDVVVENTSSAQQVCLVARGGNMLRANSFYLDGKRIDDAVFERCTYDFCKVTLDRSYFAPGKWHRMEVGFSCWGVLNFLSSPIWVEWTY